MKKQSINPQLKKRMLLSSIVFGFIGFTSVLSLFMFKNDYVNNTKDRSPSSVTSVQSTNFIHQQTLWLGSFEKNKKFYLANTNSHSQLTILNQFNKAEIDITLTCDQMFKLAPKKPNPKIEQRNFNGPEYETFSFHMKVKDELNILLTPETKSCQLTYTDSKNKTLTAELSLLAEKDVYPWLESLSMIQEDCLYDAVTQTDKAEQYFYQAHNSQLSCPQSAEKYETLETPELGFIAKTEMLLGQKLDPTFMSNQNPYAPLDFSKAPKLKAIFLATLVYRADFYGNVMARLLKYHADHGTMVYLTTTQYMMLEKDKKLLHSLAASNGHFRLQEFKYYDPDYNFMRPFRTVDSKFRDMHIKLLITLASDENDTEHNSVVYGGRNIHDGFLFKKKPNYSKYPELVQYGTEDDFVHWNDFEMKVTSKELAQQTAAHLLKFLNRDSYTQTMNSINLHSKEIEIPLQSFAKFRHFISVPYNDNYALEDFYVSLIDSATNSIRISSPYLRPTEKILKALERAAKRKVDITIQTRIELVGDTQAWLYEEVNKESINKLFSKIKIYQWKENSILHSKFILIDGKVSFIGSINLSRRSFIQDIENGFIIHSPEITEHMESIFNSYIEKSALITQAQKRKFLPSMVIQILKNQF